MLTIFTIQEKKFLGGRIGVFIMNGYIFEPCYCEEEKLLNSNASRTFYTQKLLPGAGATLEILEPKVRLFSLLLKGTITVISSDTTCTDDNAR